MVEFYVTFSRTFTIEQQPHYIYSPRELTRWKLALAEAFDVGAVDFSNSLGRRRSLAWTEEHVDGRTSEEASESISLEQLVRTYVHEGLRIFKDRLVTEDECQRTDAMIDEITKRCVFQSDAEADFCSCSLSPWIRKAKTLRLSKRVRQYPLVVVFLQVLRRRRRKCSAATNFVHILGK